MISPLGLNSCSVINLDKTVGERDMLLKQLHVSAFQRYRPHLLNPGILSEHEQAPRVYDVGDDSSLFKTCLDMCSVGGRWGLHKGPVQGFRLVAVQAIVPGQSLFSSYENKLQRISVLQSRTAAFSDFGMTTAQLRVLSMLKEEFHERAPGSSTRTARSFYCFYGCRMERLQNMCEDGMFGFAPENYYYGTGYYAALNIEYAVRFARGDFTGGPRDELNNTNDCGARYPVVMFAATVGEVYPITPDVDYRDRTSTSPGTCQFDGQPLLPGYNCHVACVTEANGRHAVDRDHCQYVEVVFSEPSQLLPVAVLWFEEESCTFK